MNNNRRTVPRIHHIIEFQQLKVVHLLNVLQEIRDHSGNLSRVVILTSKDSTAKHLASTLRRHNIAAAPVYKQRKLKRKRKASEKFNTGHYQALIVSQSGLDTETGEISHFVNFDMTLPFPLENGNMMVVKNRRHG